MSAMWNMMEKKILYICRHLGGAKLHAWLYSTNSIGQIVGLYRQSS